MKHLDVRSNTFWILFANKLTAALPLTAPYLKYLQGKSVGTILVRGAGGGFIVNVLGTGLMFVTHVVLARAMGASSYGNFVYAFTWLNIMVLFGVLGLNNASLRFVAEYNGTQKWALMKGFVRRSNQLSLLASVFVATSTAAAVWLIHDRLDPELAVTLWVVCLVLPLHSLLAIRSAALRGLKWIIASRIAIQLVRPVLLLSAVGGVYFLARDMLKAPVVMTMNIVAFAGALLFAAVFFEKAFPRDAVSVKPEHATFKWIRVALPMLLFETIMQIESQADLLIVGFFLDSSLVGIYAAAKKATMLITFGLVAVNLIAAPMISELWYQGRKKELQRMLTLAARGIFAFTLPMSLIIIIFGKHVLSLFGPEFVSTYWSLVILACGQIVRSMTGSVEIVMLMTGHQKSAALIVAISLVADIFLCLILIPALSLIGAALATCLSHILWSGIMLVYVFKRLGFNPSIIKW